MNEVLQIWKSHPAVAIEYESLINKKRNRNGLYYKTFLSFVAVFDE